MNTELVRENWRWKWYHTECGNTIFYNRQNKLLQKYIEKLGNLLHKILFKIQYKLYGKDKHPFVCAHGFLNTILVKLVWFIENKFIRG